MIPGWVERPLPPFASVSSLYKIRSFGLDYIVLHLGAEGTLYITPHGWPCLEQILPANWFANKIYAERGKRMTLGTGTVYYLPLKPPAEKTTLRNNLELLIKFSRVGQEVPVWVAPSAEAHVSAEEISRARFVGPFEEFGLCEEIRFGPFGPPNLRIRTQRPLAIFVPPKTYEPWQLGRQDHDFEQSNQLQDEDPTYLGGAHVHLDANRDYLMLYQWAKGEDAQAFHERGELSDAEFANLIPNLVAHLESKGFHMLDIKPLHMILRKRRRNGQFLRRHNQLAYTLIDYELVVRTPAYKQWLQEQLNANIAD